MIGSPVSLFLSWPMEISVAVSLTAFYTHLDTRNAPATSLPSTSGPKDKENFPFPKLLIKFLLYIPGLIISQDDSFWQHLHLLRNSILTFMYCDLTLYLQEDNHTVVLERIKQALLWWQTTQNLRRLAHVSERSFMWSVYWYSEKVLIMFL